jgi:hypothetical protein
VLASDRRAYAPDTAWMHADDGFDRSLQAAETHYFHCAPPCSVTLPTGDAQVSVRLGYRFVPWQQTVRIKTNGSTSISAKLARNDLPAEFGRWLSADLHVHMNYGGHYRNTPEHLKQQARAEDLDVVQNLIVNKEERVPDIAYFRPGPDASGGDEVVLMHAQEYPHELLGPRGAAHLDDHLVIPDFASYRHTPLGSPYPHNPA